MLRSFSGPCRFLGRTGLIMDSMEVRSCVPGIPGMFLFCLVCQNLVNTADFLWWAIGHQLHGLKVRVNISGTKLF